MTDKMTKIDIITRTSKFEELKEALNDIGITGMTVTQVLGCGMQKGITEMYRGVPVSINLLPKVKVEIIVCEVPVQKVIDTAVEILRTGEIGDGKIFIYPVENVIKIRTGEEGVLAL
ncbi:MAG: P-II family nitrogen regulator [Vallitaleaceae bacterium]|jgi:nitrogen regulatory protein P-II 1|nr:P-II family nitrogen regulator [Vallitaleaceae bacterium]